MTATLLHPPVDHDATRRQFLTLLGAAGLLTACAAPTAPAPTRSTRTVEHLLGTTEISGTPQRVIILDDAMLGYLQPLDVTPVGLAAGIEGSDAAQVYGFGTEVPNVAPGYEPDLEAIAAVRPDLIIAINPDETVHRSLSAIAPSIVIGNDGGVPGPDGPYFTTVFATLCRALGREDAYPDQLARYTSRRDEIRARHATTIAAYNQVSYSRFYDGEGFFRIDGENGFDGAILADLGFTRPPAQLDVIAAETRADPAAEDFFPNVDVSLERIALAEGDLLIVPDAGFFDEVAAGPLFGGLVVVEAGRMFPVERNRWFSRSLAGALFVLDDVDRILTTLAP